ncbi:hypothetical protein LCGC14_2872750 [marine sediment metagenome]|uniref:STAS/SEC14 domain-containing protein n=1 Tax=marine sediment metagenome TaxID=412755 RepID=A0A0F8YP75_9ZZZZ
MPYQISWEKKGVVQKFHDVITPIELISCNENVYGDSRFDAIRYQILNLTEVRTVDLTDPDKAIQLVRRIAATDRAAAKSNPNMKIAIVASLEILGSLANLYSSELSDSPWLSDVFETETEAREWLGI